MELLASLGRTFGFSLAAGVNLYATVAILGLVTRFDLVSLPPQYAVFNNDWIIGGALALYAVEFIADKVPWVDTLWDAVHTFIRPVGGALIAIASLGEASPGLEALVAVAGGSLAAGSHLTKASARVAANTSPEPFTNWTLSVLGDIFVFVLGFLALQYPLAALAVTAVIVIVMILAIRLLIRALFRRPAPPSASGATL
jgi:hypothetical protein